MGRPGSGGPRSVFRPIVGCGWACMVASRCTAERLPRRAPTSRPTARASTTTTWPRAPGWPDASAPRPTARSRTSGISTVTPTSGGSPARTRRRYAAWSPPHRRQCGAVRRDHRQRAQDMVLGRGVASGDRRGVRRSAGPSGGAGHRLGGRPRHHPGRATRPAGSGAGRADRGSHRPALHLSGRRPAPAPASPVQRPGLRRGQVAGAAHGRIPRLARGAERDRACGDDDRPGVPCRTRRGRAHLRPGVRRDRRAGAVRRPVQRAGGADRSEHRPLRGRVADDAPRTRSPDRRSVRRGTAEPGRRRGPTRSSPQTAPSWSSSGPRSCTPSAIATHRPERCHPR